MSLALYILMVVSWGFLVWFIRDCLRADDKYEYDPTFLCDVHGARTARNRRERQG